MIKKLRRSESNSTFLPLSKYELEILSQVLFYITEREYNNTKKSHNLYILKDNSHITNIYNSAFIISCINSLT